MREPRGGLIMKKAGYFVGSCLAIILLLSGCGKKQSAENSGNLKANMATKQVVNWSETEDLTTLDPSKLTQPIDITMVGNTNEGLYRLGNHHKLLPGIATKMTESRDGKVYTFNLRKNAKWSNGDAVVAHDFEYSWKRTINPKTVSQYGYIFDGIKNANKIQARKAKPSTLGVKAIGKYKLQVTLERPIPYFKLLMAFPLFFPQNQKAVEKYGKAYGTSSAKMVYNGPFKMNGWTGTNEKWTLTANKNYWDKKHVYLEKINDQVVKDPSTMYNMYQGNQLDVATLSGTQVKNELNNKDMHVLKDSRIFYLEFNQRTRPAFKNKALRQAFSYAMDRQSLTKNVLADGSVPAQGFVTQGLASNPKTGEDFTKEAKQGNVGLEYNPTKAKAAYKQVLKELHKKSLQLEVLCGDSTAAKHSAAYVQGQLEKILPNLKISIASVPLKSLIQRQTHHQFDFFVSNWGADYSYPYTFLQVLQSNNTFNEGGWTNKNYDKLVQKSASTDATNPQKRWQDMIDASRVIMSDQGVAPLYQATISQMRKAKIKGIIYNSAGLSFNLKGMYVAK
ncbi:ABC transporter, substrate-binding protein, family 5 [Lentilactobacillus kisonensis F0435]|uniref:ABC transporter, substrate-binding protein, family 5 n=2 Tax=Lentilactobacillus kisonensis TaxID=481722 RepID=H1LF46_9LACO|nr:ABC transporter, substrate-binding protein, family 5 [Lentilactobacillus kisonensis F0435]